MAVITIDRTNYNALIDDDGTNTKGTPWSKNQVKIVLMDPIDGALAKLLPLAGGTIAGNLGVTGSLSVTGFGTHGFVAGAAGAMQVAIQNTAAGTGNYAALAMGNDASGSLLTTYAFASNYASANDTFANGALIRSTGIGGLALSATHASGLLRFFTNFQERARIDQNGAALFFGALNAAGPVSFGYAGGGLLNLRNSQNSATSRTDFNMGNDTSASLLDIATYASGYTQTAGFDLPNGTLFYHAGAGGLSFYTANGGAALSFWTGGALRMRIAGNGDSTWGTFTFGQAFMAFQSGTLNLGAPGTTFSGILLFNNGNGQVGTITVNGTTTAYNTTSDVRLKNDRGRATNLEALRAVVVHDFQWKADDRWDRGVFAQEAASEFPRAVSEGTDETTESGALARPWMTDYSKFVPDLIVGWQQHEATIAQLRAELAALKG
jgi:Chaperone of endosialidase